MDETCSVKLDQRIHHLEEDAKRLFPVHAAALQTGREGLAFEKLENQKWPALVFRHFVQLASIAV